MKQFQKKCDGSNRKIGMNTAVKAAGATSFYGCHQPKEPKMLKEMK